MSSDDPRGTADTRPELVGMRWERHTLDVAPAEPVPEVASAIAPGEPPPASAFDPRARRFELGAELGRGGMGRVVAATDTALDRPVAIKQAHTDRVEDLMRFEREVRITAQLEHPAIVPIHDAGRDAQGRPFYIMRRIEGEPLSDRAAAARDVRGRLALVPYVLAAVDAAAFAHARGVIHRDIKPWNILVGAYGETLLIDWGLARRLDEPEDAAAAADAAGAPAAPPAGETPPLTRAGFAMGTPGYMAPEQARGERERVDARADVYALGATLLHALCGTSPFDGAPATTWLERAARGEPPPMDRIAPEVPAELIAIVVKAMAGNPGDRYADASALAADLRAFLAGQLVAAHAYTARERLARFVRKHRVAVAVGGAAAIALATVAVLAVQRIVHAREVADAARVDAEAGQHLAAERAEQMLLDRASMLATTDPTRAVALLRGFPVGSRSIRRARDIAAVAAGSGIAHAAATHTDQINALEVSPDGRWLLSAGEDGVVQVHELATGRTRTLAPSVGPVMQALWLDGGASIIHDAYPHGLYAVDVASGARLELAGGASVGALWASGPDSVRYVDRDARTLVERTSARDGAPALLARDVDTALGNGELAVVEGGGRLRLVGRGAERVLATYGAGSPGDLRLALSPALGRVAAASGGEVVEWTLDGAPHGRWRIPRVTLLAYTHAALYAAALAGRNAIYYLGKQAEEELTTTSPAMWITVTGRGLALGTEDGAIWVFGAAGIHRLGFERPGSRVLGSRAGSTVLAMGARDGSVRWWDLAQVVPETHALPAGTMCAYDAAAIYVHDDNAIDAVDRATGAVRRVVPRVTTNKPQAYSLVCRGSLASGALVFGDGTRPATVVADLRTGRSLELPGVPYVAIDDAADALVFRRGREVVELPHGTEPARVRWTAPREVDVVGSAGRWIAAALVDGTLARIDRVTGAVALAATPAPVALFGLTPDGTTWFSLGHALWRWDGARPPERLSELPGELVEGTLLPDSSFAFALADHSMWHATDTRVVVRAAPGQRTLYFGARGIAVTTEGTGRAVVRYLATGESLARQLTMPIRTVVPGDRDRSIALQVGNIAAFYGDAVPEDVTGLDAWIARATNAVIEPESDALTWH